MTWRSALRSNREVLLAVGALSAIAYGILAFHLTLAGDDWSAVLDPRGKHQSFLSLGRWMTVLLWKVVGDGLFAPTFTLALFVAGALAGAFVLARTLGLEDRAEVFVFTALFTFCPVLAEQAVFKSNHVSLGVGFLLASLAVALATRALRRRLAGEAGAWSATAGAAGLMALAVGNQQSLLLFGVAACAGAALASRWDESRPSPGAFVRAAALVYGLTCVLGGALYWGATTAIQAVAGIEARSSGKYSAALIENSEQFARNLERLGDHLFQFLLESQHLWPGYAKVAFLLALGWTLLRTWKRPRSRSASPAPEALLLLALAALLLLAPWLLGLVRRPDNSYRYTALMGLVPLYPVAFALALRATPRGTHRTLALGLSGAVVAMFVFAQNAASVSTLTSNWRDLALSQRILARIEAHPDYASLPARHEIVLVGQLPAAEEGPPFSLSSRAPMSDSVVQAGVYREQPHRFRAIMAFCDYPNELRTFSTLSNKTFQQLSPQRLAQARAALRAAKPWPAWEAVQFAGDRIFVVLQVPDGN